MENQSEGTFDKIEFVDTPQQLQESLAADLNQQPQAETQQPEAQPEVQPEAAPAPAEQPQAESMMIQGQTQEEAPISVQHENTTDASAEAPIQYSSEEIEGAVFNFLSERLGRDISSLDDLSATQEETRQIDERVKAIADFVETTGRSPRDWFAYQSLNPSEMEDSTAIRVQLASEYPGLSSEEIGMLVNDKYKLDTDLYSEDEVKLSRLQLKIDATKAKAQIEDIRSKYNAPDPEVARSSSFITDEWLSNMSKEVDALEGLEFDLGNGNAFKFGLEDSYRNQLKDKSARLDKYFDSFVREDGSWDFDALNSQLAVMDNIDAIVSAAYKQGKGDGQKGLVDKVANVSMDTAQRTGEQNVNSVAEQLKQIIGSGSTTTFKI